jgi:hypothetical protein
MPEAQSSLCSGQHWSRVITRSSAQGITTPAGRPSASTACAPGMDLLHALRALTRSLHYETDGLQLLQAGDARKFHNFDPEMHQSLDLREKAV